MRIFELRNQIPFQQPMPKNLVILGAGGCAWEVAWLVSEIDRHRLLVECKDRGLRQMDGETLLRSLNKKRVR